ncbi:hypothetical protein HYZ97_04520 [Candidatus Pacearchaeota archaeon]|nr:hypothetical protein [Candidatus Pacearchaeota archaeon]
MEDFRKSRAINALYKEKSLGKAAIAGASLFIVGELCGLEKMALVGIGAYLPWSARIMYPVCQDIYYSRKGRN